MAWYEFAACSGSTVGIFCLVAHACHQDCTALLVRNITDAYFPWVQGLHILLDYLIDQDEDRRGGDLNFCSYYHDYREMVARLSHFYKQANLSISALPYARFHRLINQGLLGIYCADKKFAGRRKSEWRPENWFSWEAAWACFSILSAGCTGVWRPVIRNLHTGPLRDLRRFCFHAVCGVRLDLDPR